MSAAVLIRGSQDKVFSTQRYIPVIDEDVRSPPLVKRNLPNLRYVIKHCYISRLFAANRNED